MSNSRDPEEGQGRERSDSDAEWEAIAKAREKQNKILGIDEEPVQGNEVAAAEGSLKAGDILIFKIPEEKPSMTDRFIRFAQRLKGGHHPEDADAVHVAVVTKGGNNPLIAHYTSNGLTTDDILHSTIYQNHPHEIFRPKALGQQIADAAKESKTNIETDTEIKTNYSLIKMVSAFLKGEKKLSDKTRESMPKLLYQKGYGEHVCSTFVAAVIKNIQKEHDTQEKTLDTSYLLPSKLFAKLKTDKTNFERIVPSMNNEEKCRKLMDVVDHVVARLEEQKKSALKSTKGKIQNKIDEINAARKVYENNKKDDPAVLVAIMVNPIAINTSTGSKQSSTAQLFLQAARKLGVDTSKQEKYLASAKSTKNNSSEADLVQTPKTRL